MRHFSTPLARQFVSASSQYIEIDAAALQAEPLTMDCWFNSDSVTAGQSLMWIGASGVSNREMYLAARGDVAGDPVSIDVDALGAGFRAVTTTSYFADRWHHACGVFRSTTSRDVYLDGGGKGSSTGFRNTATYNRMSVGRLGRASPALYMSGNVLWPTIRNIALSDDEIVELARGSHPLTIRPETIVAFWDWTGANTEFGRMATYPLINAGSSPVGGPHFLSHHRTGRWQSHYAASSGVTIPVFMHHYQQQGIA